LPDEKANTTIGREFAIWQLLVLFSLHDTTFSQSLS